MKSFNLMSHSIDKEKQQVSHIGKFSKATDRIVKQD